MSQKVRILILLLAIIQDKETLNETEANKTGIDHQPNFHRNPCEDALGQVVNARTRDEVCARAFMTRACAFLHGSI